LSQTSTPEDDEEYEDRHRNYEADQNACRRHRGEDLIWHTHLQRQECNLNQRAQQLDLHEAHLHRRECICDRYESQVHAARLSGTGRGDGSGSVSTLLG
jgi:hypothetical protein